MLAKSKVSSIDMDISHKEFITILKGKDRYEMMEDNLRNKMENRMKL